MAALGISELSKEATRLKNSGDLEGAIACLRKAKSLRWASEVHYPIKSWTRLPLFLQAAGRMDEAMTEFQELLETAEREIERFHSHNIKQVRNMLTHATLAEIYTAMSRACKREKRVAEAEKYESMEKAWKSMEKGPGSIRVFSSCRILMSLAPYSLSSLQCAFGVVTLLPEPGGESNKVELKRGPPR